MAAANTVMRSGRLHRYNSSAGDESEVMALKQEYTTWQGTRFYLAVASCSQAIQIADHIFDTVAASGAEIAS